MRRLALIVVALLLMPATAVASEEAPSVNEIEGEVMCPVCGTLLELAESPQAQREKVFIKRLIGEGRTKQEIKDALVAEYGSEVLAEPEGTGFNLSAYVVPIVAFVAAVIALAIGIWRWRRSGGGGENGAAPRPEGPSAAQSERLDADLGRYDL